MDLHSTNNASPFRVVLALIIAAILGGMLTGIEYGWNLFQNLGEHHFEKYGLMKSFSIAAFASVFWLVGLVFIAGPFWIFFHIIGAREAWHAIALGVLLLSFITLGLSTSWFDGQSDNLISRRGDGVWLWQDGRITQQGWVQAIKSSIFKGFLGGVIGFIIWRISYRTSK